jgi:hypothetical protein
MFNSNQNFHRLLICLYLYLIIKFSFVDNESFVIFGLLVFLSLVFFQLKKSLYEQYSSNVDILTRGIFELVQDFIAFSYFLLTFVYFKLSYMRNIFNFLLLITRYHYRSFKLNSLLNNSEKLFYLSSLKFNLVSDLDLVAILDTFFYVLNNNLKIINIKQKLNLF